MPVLTPAIFTVCQIIPAITSEITPKSTPNIRDNSLVKWDVNLSEYVRETDQAKLPLGEEFQKHVKVFLKVKTGPGGGATKQSEQQKQQSQGQPQQSTDTATADANTFNMAYKRAFKLIDCLE